MISVFIRFEAPSLYSGDNDHVASNGWVSCCTLGSQGYSWCCAIGYPYGTLMCCRY